MVKPALSSSFSRRTFLLGTGKAVLMTTLVGRLFYLQILESSKYQLLSENNRIASRVILPLRGQIVDRHGDVIASNKSTFKAVYLNDKQVDARDVLALLTNVIPLSDEDKERIADDIKQSPSLAPITIAEQLSWDEVSAIELHTGDLPGVGIDVGQARAYPHQGAFSHVVGYVAKLSDKEKNDDDAYTNISGVQVGKIGIEKVCEPTLRGVPGSKNLEVNAKRQVVRELAHEDGMPGHDLQLTLDLNLQKFIAQRLSAHKSGSAVLLDVQQGHVLAAVSHPTFDPNLFVKGIPSGIWNDILNNPYKPLTNKAFAGTYAPGSAIKILMIVAFLEAGIAPHEKVFCPGFTEVNGHRFHCMKGHGAIDMHGAIRESCDVYFYDNGRKIGIDAMEVVFRRYGLGTKIFPGFPGEASGLVPSKAWKLDKRGAKWTVSDTIMTSIGQGYHLATPLQMAMMLARIIHKGDMPLSLVMGDCPELNTRFDHVHLDPKHRDIILRGMMDVTNHPKGTAYRNRIPHVGFEMGGKSGTSQVTRIRDADRKRGITTTSHRSWLEREHAVFVGFAPLHDPRFVISVLIEHGEGGGRVAAPVAADILYAAQKQYKG